MKIYEKLQKIQAELKAPKSQFNKFGGYNYRSCEDILEAAKPLLNQRGLALSISDEIVQVGERYYIKATARLIDTEEGETYETTAFAREAKDKKGMDDSQITGAASSYARKYALNGLFSIDDNKDADYTNKHNNGTAKKAEKKTKKPAKNKKKSAGDDVRTARINGLKNTAANNGSVLDQDDMNYLGKEIKAMGKEKLEDLTQEEYQSLAALLKQRIMKKGA
ncbi:ERF family protein [Halarsenatibacter silvermanii]|uniref:ERF superfamily protein n=1 Tax=Halarsenatibacter silvermanii TaxID=321763 RepID=A0A1G9NLL5_9FIRM|nr:ERF family protein [Halarsenatibacter silvermanii]SDL87254.1 ERF superfamily protein [Halarsenatibacter silvermanii]